MLIESTPPALHEGAPPRFTGTASGMPPCILLDYEDYPTAGNDDTCIDDVAASLDLDLWGRRASAASGFGDAGAIPVPTPSATRGTLALYRVARNRQARAVGSLIMRVIRGIGAAVHRLRQHARQRRQLAEIVAGLNELDDRTLHDLGFHRSEIASIGAEVTGECDCTRVRTLLTLYGLPR
jgi:uncharacterized protein YjiS (DUF1127 family)